MSSEGCPGLQAGEEFGLRQELPGGAETAQARSTLATLLNGGAMPVTT